MSTPTVMQPASEAAKKVEEKAEKKVGFSLDVSEQELLEEFGVLRVVAEYGYGA
jgi:hypothetical protein